MVNKKILIVEDDTDVLLGYRILLKANNYDTFQACDGVFAISEARRHQPDLVILDLGLPAGDGFTVLERFRAIPSLAGIPVVVVSGRNINTSKERAFAAGAKAFLQKPWDDKKLLQIIGQLLGLPQSSDEASSTNGRTFLISNPVSLSF